MHILHRRGWEIPESQATPERIYLSRRALLGGMTALAAGAALPSIARADADPTADLYPAKRNDKFVLDRELTPESKAGNYNNFYEYGTDKYIADRAQQLKPRPWTVKFDGMVEKEKTVGIDDLIRAMPLEERLYRMRCVEAWSMAVPWTGFALAKLVEYAKPLSSAKYLRMETFLDSSMAPAQRLPFFPWPYVEGLTMAEATNELAFMVTGIYGKPAVKQHGAPLRLVTPWKYGFKGIKSIMQLHLHRPAAEGHVGSDAGERIRILGERESASVASALEPGERGRHRHARAAADASVQRLRRICRRPLQGSRKRKALCVSGILPIPGRHKKTRRAPGDGGREPGEYPVHQSGGSLTKRNVHA